MNFNDKVVGNRDILLVCQIGYTAQPNINIEGLFNINIIYYGTGRFRYNHNVMWKTVLKKKKKTWAYQVEISDFVKLSFVLRLRV